MKCRSRQFVFIIVCAVVVMFSQACANKMPPNLTPQAQHAFVNTQALKVLDLIRDVAVDGNAATPQVFQESTTRKVVAFHRSALKTIDAAGSGWSAAVQQGLTELLKDLPPSEQQVLQPYISLAISALKGFQ